MVFDSAERERQLAGNVIDTLVVIAAHDIDYTTLRWQTLNAIFLKPRYVAGYYARLSAPVGFLKTARRR